MPWEHSDRGVFRYCGEYWDKERGEIYLRARSYNPGSGRFTSEDPAKDGGNWSFLPGRATLAFREGSLGPHALGAYDCRIEGPSFAGLEQPGGPLADP